MTNRVCFCHTAGRRRSGFTAVIPAALIALLPKCPACLAVYLALATGIAIPLETAAYLRLAIITLCLLWLLNSIRSLAKRKALYKAHSGATLVTWARTPLE